MTAAFPLVPWPTTVEPGTGAVDLARVVVVSDTPLRWTPLATELLAPLGIDVRGAGPQVLAKNGEPPKGTLIELRLAETVVEPVETTPPAIEPSPAVEPSPVVEPPPLVEPVETPDESYTLETRPDGVTITAPAEIGLLHGLRTLRQLVGLDRTAPAVVVHDAPRFAWRGLTLDVARHWFGPAVLRRVVDLAGAYKLRVLHLHLTDDQGWRIEVPSRPALAQVSGPTQSGGLVPDGERGYLTLDEYRELQEYAAARFVEIVPEIDLPGHTNAATHACGELRPDGVPTPAYGGMEVGFSRLWFDNPATEPWIKDVLADVAAATLGPHVHVGGDECHTLDEPEYSRLVGLALDAVRSAGKTPVAWQEAAPAAGAGTVLQYWDPRADPAALLRAAEAGARFVMSPATHAYLDMQYEPGHPLGQDWSGFVDLHRSYEWEPTTALPGLQAEAVVGVSAALWTETLETADHVFSMLLPRLPAVAEVAWTAPSSRDWQSFRTRIVAHAPTWDAEGWAWHPSKDAVWAPPAEAVAAREA
ncbi:Beta-N-acetylhexosaminidase [Xylanimonas cellulosilytica DSM 15894]|uniref:beta-N-acetylhexosaminidase n=1 Tax=Xylanimonas cellulosilytica (strain DSM 15894 / JCM 12276 / CECT 5975 / KCTC 9989 / LMG 20990 / NBRC 107835 / XIL07) TaxID=446471 RepID=D1BXW0_XYLCX|nr:family 20 glycosylhydrolase [Xylanimonas cellulosilytica]ACZ31751.1 Beta-N-acetylhexosaminidase [Xylanimonas cellulosilytica DSM 15894]